MRRSARFGTICKFIKREKHLWMSATFSKVASSYFPAFGLNTELVFRPNAGKYEPATLLKVILLQGCFSRFFKLYKWHQIAQSITYVLKT